MFGSSLASAASVLFVLSFFPTSPLPTIEPPEMPRLQTTSDASAASAKSQSARDSSTSAAAPVSSEAQASPAAQESDPLKRPLPDKKKRFGKLSKEGSAYNKWLDEEVPWIVTDEERAAFKLLSNDAEREKFIE